MQWGAPISRGGTAITGYTATAFDAPNGGNVLGPCSTDGGGRACTFPGTMGVQYYAEVVAQNAQGSPLPRASGSGGTEDRAQRPRVSPSPGHRAG